MNEAVTLESLVEQPFDLLQEIGASQSGGDGWPGWRRSAQRVGGGRLPYRSGAIRRRSRSGARSADVTDGDDPGPWREALAARDREPAWPSPAAGRRQDAVWAAGGPPCAGSPALSRSIIAMCRPDWSSTRCWDSDASTIVNTSTGGRRQLCAAIASSSGAYHRGSETLGPSSVSTTSLVESSTFSAGRRRVTAWPSYL